MFQVIGAGQSVRSLSGGTICIFNILLGLAAVLGGIVTDLM